MERKYNVLFLCTGNSARSIMAEAIMNFKGRPRFTAYSAGSHPTGTVRPEALRQIEQARLPFKGFRSKSWEEFSKPGAPELDFVFTVCDSAAKEVCPIWPGQPMTSHWGVPDPASVHGSHEQIAKAFRDAFFMLDKRISLFLNLPLSSLDNLSIKREIDKIGQDKIGEEKTGQEKIGQDKIGQEKTGQEKIGQDKIGQEKTGQEKISQQ